MLTFPNAKINLGLQVLGKRPDGFHALHSCFCPVGWTDLLEILPAETTTFVATGLPIPGQAADNLCLKAYHALQRAHDLPPVRIHLHKIVPIGAGLGGGSADAAFAINALNDLFGLGLSPEQREDYARPLGSDCAFFVRNQPAFCTDRGDACAPFAPNLVGCAAVLVNPGVHIGTAEAYAGLRLRPGPRPDLRALLAQPPATWRDAVENDFEERTLERYPVVGHLKAQLYAAGALYASMTGSGSTVYGIFRENVDKEETAPTLADWRARFSDCTVWCGNFN